jgi:hypothetical protein
LTVQRGEMRQQGRIPGSRSTMKIVRITPTPLEAPARIAVPGVERAPSAAVSV